MGTIVITHLSAEIECDARIVFPVPEEYDMIDWMADHDDISSNHERSQERDVDTALCESLGPQSVEIYFMNT